MSDPELVVGFALLGATGIGLMASLSLGAVQLLEILKKRRTLGQCQVEAQALDQLRTDLMILEMEYQFPDKPASRRHNLHCPVCGRFAKRLLHDSESVVVCVKHDMQIVWKSIPVDWTVPEHTTVNGVLVTTEVVQPETAAILLPVLTGPVPIVDYDWIAPELENVR